MTLVSVRFRPVAPLDGSPGDPVAQARSRWTHELRERAGVSAFSFGQHPDNQPAERPEVDRRATAVDVTIEFETLADANALFDDKPRFEYLCGGVSGPPAVRVDGESHEAHTP